VRAVSQNEFGGPEVLTLIEVDMPEIEPTEVLVKVHAASINPLETVIRSGRHALIGDPPFVLGWDVSGVVEEILPGTHRFAVGDEVFGMPMFPRQLRGYSEYVAAPSRQLVRKPASLSHAEAAGLAMAGLTAWQGLVDTAGMDKGDRVLIHAAGGGVGHLAVQIAKARGAYVVATASAEKRDYVLGLGADEVIDYRTTAFEDVTTDIDIVLDLIGRDYPERSFKTMRPGGILVSGVDRKRSEMWVKAQEAGLRFAGIIVEPDQVGLDALVALVETGQLRIDIERTFPLEEAAAAHRLLEEGHVTGKVILIP
jgi:NADPH:quinone reductase-like Zn-dependent oxidoreductase